MAQLDLFGRSGSRPSVSQAPDLERIRQVLGGALSELRAAEKLPWEAPRLKSWQHLFQNMTKWLPDQERDEFRQSFAAELTRLRQGETDLPIDGR